MILTKKIIIKISANNITYWKNKGYIVPKLGRQLSNRCSIEVSVDDLSNGSQVNVLCKCDKCKNEYAQRISRNTSVCGSCRTISFMLGNSFGSAHKGKPQPKMRGPLHPRWNENKSALLTYTREVHRLTKESYIVNKHIINPNDYKRTLCGVDGGYQLDHIMSIKDGFDKNIPSRDIASTKNLQMLPWKENRAKW